MKGKTRFFPTSLLVLAAFVVLWGLLVALGLPGQHPGLLHPRIWSRALAASIVLVTLAAWHLFSPRQAAGDKALHPAAVIPLVILLLLVPPALRRPGVDQDRLNIAGGGMVPGVSRESSELLTAVDSLFQDDAAGYDRSADPDSLLASAGPIVIGDKEYTRVIGYIWDAPHRFSGRSVETVAFVFRRPDWDPGIFTAARLSIWCCIDDAAMIGLLAEAGSWDAPVESDWIRIRGTLSVLDQFETGTVTLKNVPVLRDITWESVPKPEFEYVFPGDW